MPLSTLLSPCFRVGDDPEFAAVVDEAVRREFPGVAVQALQRLEEAAPRAGQGDQLLLLCDPSAALQAEALGARDGAGLARWAVVVFGVAQEPAADLLVPVLARADWNPALVARALGGALARHRLAQENARLRGAIATMGFRVAHDLRTPLGGILTTTEMLREILGEDAPNYVPLLQPILESTEGLKLLIERMSFVAKAISTREPAQRVNMNLPFWTAFQRVEHALLKAGASLVQPREWPAVNGHESWLEHVWTNLLRNALQHGGAEVKIEAGWTPVGGAIKFWLRTSGVVPAERCATLFYPLHRMHEPSAPRGLGLAIVRQLVELDGGQCGFEAPADGGSVFFFVLPAAQPTEAGPPRPSV